VEVVSQIEVQRWPGRGYPSSKLVLYLLREAGLLKPFERLRVVDMTFGQGVWWMSLPQARIAGFDVRRLDWKRRPSCFFQQPCQSWRLRVAEIEECLGGQPDLVAVDPPWERCVKGNGCRGRGARYHYRASRAVGPPESILEAARQAALYWGVHLLVHYETRWIPAGLKPVVELWWKPFLPNVDKYDYRNWWAVLR